MTVLTAADPEAVGERLRRGEPFWLDLHRPGPRDYDVLREVFAFHPLAVEDSERFGQRPKLEEYDDFVFLVLYGASPDEDRLVEIHCFLGARFLVTVRRDEAPAIDALRGRPLPPRPADLLHLVLDGLVDSFFPLLAEVDERLDALGEELLRRVAEDQLRELFELRRRLAAVRRVVAAERDLVARLLLGTARLPGLTAEGERYFRDVYDHLVRLAEAVDTHRELIEAATDLYLSTASNRLNAVMKQLTVIATIFLPLTFVTGFFGQNFGWLVEHVGGWPQFAVLGLGLEAAVVAAMLVLFRRRGWF